MDKSQIDVHYIKNNDFKSIFVTGAYGGIAGSGLLNLNLFTERAPIPSSITYELIEGGFLGEEISRTSRDGIIREVQIGLLMDENTARSLISFLTKALETNKNPNSETALASK